MQGCIGQSSGCADQAAMMQLPKAITCRATVGNRFIGLASWLKSVEREREKEVIIWLVRLVVSNMVYCSTVFNHPWDADPQIPSES